MKPFCRSAVSSALLYLLAASAAQGQTPADASAQAQQSASRPSLKPFALTIDNIMRGPGLFGYAPRFVHWSQDSKRVFFDWKKADEPDRKEYGHYVVNADGSGLRLLSEEEGKTMPPTGGELSHDKRLTVFVDAGDIYLYDHAKGSRRQITATSEFEFNPHFTRDDKSVVFERQNNLYLLSLDGGLLRQLTDIRQGAGAAAASTDALAGARSGGRRRAGGALPPTTGSAPPPGADPPPTTITTNQDALKKDQTELFESVRERAEQRAEQEKKRVAQEKDRRRPFLLAPGQFASGLELSPDGTYVSAFIFEGEAGAKSDFVPNFVTESGYVEEGGGRGKVGDAQGSSRLVVLDVKTGTTRRVTFTPPALTATGVKAGARRVDWINLQWSEDGKWAVALARSGDNKDLWLLAVDPASGKTTLLTNTHDDAWVGGPDWSTFGFLPDNRRVYFVSERDGFAHLYTVSLDSAPAASDAAAATTFNHAVRLALSTTATQDGRAIYSTTSYTPQQAGPAIKQLTQGKFEISQARLSEDKKRFYFLSSEAGPAERYLYAMPIEGGTRTRIARLSHGDADGYAVSPDDTTLALIRSEGNRPPELFLVPNRPPSASASSGASASDTDGVQVTHSPTEEWLSYNWIAPPIVTYAARDGADVAARLYKPAQWKRGGAAIIFTHGAGYLQNVHNGWSHYDREYMFHHLLMARGYLVLDVDYRGSAGYGRDWRTGIYRHMGGKDLDDVVDGARWLTAAYGVNPRRIGTYGGSYGGFLTLMAMFTAPDVFAAGAALRPVTNWANYNHDYTASILNEPQNDPEAYRRSSPIFFAQGLKGALLICHGMVDDNVHFQDSVLLAQRLIELHKENWELAPYPVESHAFTHPSSWTDEYKRILKLFDANLKPASKNVSK